MGIAASVARLVRRLSKIAGHAHLQIEDEAARRDAVVDVVAALQDAQQRESVEDFVSLFRDDATWVTAGGRRLIGRQEIAEFTQQVLPGAMRDSSATYQVVHVVFVRSDVAVIAVRQRPVDLTGQPLDDRPEGRPTYVMSEEADGWRIVAGQNTQVAAWRAPRAQRHMPRRNRVDPWGDLHADAARGLFTGNRGCLVDDHGAVVRHHGSALWIVCRTSFRGWRHPLAAPRRWTPIFFLDDAVALAAGHRPCATCRRGDYLSYRDAVSTELGAAAPLLAKELDARLVAERHRRGRGLERAGDRLTWLADAERAAGRCGVVVDEAASAAGRRPQLGVRLRWLA